MALTLLKKKPVSLLEEARAALAGVEAELEQLRIRRLAVLAGPDWEQELPGIDAERAALQTRADGWAGRIQALEVQATQAEQERQVKENEARTARTEAVFAEADAIAAEKLVPGLQQAIAAFDEIVELRAKAGAACPFDAGRMSGAAVGGGAIQRLVANEIFRLGHHPFLGGRAGEQVRVSFPGGQAPNHGMLGMPERTKPLVNALKEASSYASQLLRGKRT